MDLSVNRQEFVRNLEEKAISIVREMKKRNLSQVSTSLTDVEIYDDGDFKIEYCDRVFLEGNTEKYRVNEENASLDLEDALIKIINHFGL